MGAPIKSDFDEIKAWLMGFSVCVNTQNHKQAKELFSEMAVYYGIHTSCSRWTDNIVEEEWAKEWPYITDFTWNYKLRIVFESLQPYIASVFLPWEAIGYTADGRQYKRSGRATFILGKRDHPLKCYHAHLTLNPRVPRDSYGLTKEPEPEKT